MKVYYQELKKIIDRNIEEISKLKQDKALNYMDLDGAIKKSKEEFENLGEFPGW